MIAASVDLEAACCGVWDVIILGAGPAGAIAAAQLARTGLRTMLLDRRHFPRPKVCGGCVNLVALDILKSVGMEDLVNGLEARTLKTLRLGISGRSAEFCLPGGMAVSRERLDAALVEAAVRRGATFLPGTCGLVGSLEAEARRVHLIQPDRKLAAQARVVLVATGLGATQFEDDSVVRSYPAKGSRIGAGCLIDQFPDSYEEGVVHMAVGRAGYVGMVRVEQGKLNVAAAVDVSAVKGCGGLGPAIENTLSHSTFAPAPALRDAGWHGTPLLTRRAHPIAGERFFLIGDATGYVEPVTGEGIAWAMMTGRAIAPLVAQAIDHWDPSLPRAWASLHRRLIGSQQFLCRGLSILLRHPGLTLAALEIAVRVPRLARSLIQRTCSPWQHPRMS